MAGLGDLTADNRHIIAMTWIVEGVALISAAFVVAATVVEGTSAASSAVYAVAAATLVALALVSLFIGFRIAFLPFRLCPFVLGTAADSLAIVVQGALAVPVAGSVSLFLLAAAQTRARAQTHRLRPQRCKLDLPWAGRKR